MEKSLNVDALERALQNVEFNLNSLKKDFLGWIQCPICGARAKEQDLVKDLDGKLLPRHNIPCIAVEHWQYCAFVRLWQRLLTIEERLLKDLARAKKPAKKPAKNVIDFKHLGTEVAIRKPKGKR